MARPTPSLRERNRARTHTEIAQAAVELFEAHGFDATTVDQIAAAAQISPATFFRYYPAKEDVLFADQDGASADLRERVAGRTNPTHTVAALAEPVREYAEALMEEDAPMQRLTRLVMTTPSLAPRSLRLRLRWERELSLQLSAEAGRETPHLRDTVVAATAVACLTSALRHWSSEDTSSRLGELVQQAFTEIS